MGAAIKFALRNKPEVIPVDVTVDPEWQVRGEACVVFHTRGSAYKRPYTLEELRKILTQQGPLMGATESAAKRLVYFCDDTVPADIRDALNPGTVIDDRQAPSEAAE